MKIDNPWEHAGLTRADVLTRDGTIKASVGKKELDTDKGEGTGVQGLLQTVSDNLLLSRTRPSLPPHAIE